MAIELITGLPGNAKTLHALGRAIERSSSEQRPVYYAGLKGFNPDDPRLKGIVNSLEDTTQKVRRRVVAIENDLPDFTPETGPELG